MTDLKSNYYLVREEILPEAIKKTIKVKELLKKGEVRTINEAVEMLNLSRSAYYKYKDFVFPFYEASKEKIVTVALLLKNLVVAYAENMGSPCVVPTLEDLRRYATPS